VGRNANRHDDGSDSSPWQAKSVPRFATGSGCMSAGQGGLPLEEWSVDGGGGGKCARMKLDR
jgi:hypothetical protein